MGDYDSWNNYDSYGAENYGSWDNYDSGYDNYGGFSGDYDNFGSDSYGFDYGYNNYGYDSYEADGQYSWQYTYDDIPECVKENCEQALSTCAGEANCVSAIEGIVNECIMSDDMGMCIENLFVYEAKDTESKEKLKGFCGGDDMNKQKKKQCFADLKELGGCCIEMDVIKTMINQS